MRERRRTARTARTVRDAARCMCFLCVPRDGRRVTEGAERGVALVLLEVVTEELLRSWIFSTCHMSCSANAAARRARQRYSRSLWESIRSLVNKPYVSCVRSCCPAIMQKQQWGNASKCYGGHRFSVGILQLSCDTSRRAGYTRYTTMVRGVRTAEEWNSSNWKNAMN